MRELAGVFRGADAMVGLKRLRLAWRVGFGRAPIAMLWLGAEANGEDFEAARSRRRKELGWPALPNQVRGQARTRGNGLQPQPTDKPIHRG